MIISTMPLKCGKWDGLRGEWGEGRMGERSYGARGRKIMFAFGQESLALRCLSMLSFTQGRSSSLKPAYLPLQ